MPIVSKRLPGLIAFTCTPTIWPFSYFGRMRAWENRVAGLRMFSGGARRARTREAASSAGVPAGGGRRARRRRRPRGGRGRDRRSGRRRGGLVLGERELALGAVLDQHDPAPLDPQHGHARPDLVVRPAPPDSRACRAPRSPPRRSAGSSAETVPSSVSGSRVASRSSSIAAPPAGRQQRGIEEIATQDHLPIVPARRRLASAVSVGAASRSEADAERRADHRIHRVRGEEAAQHEAEASWRASRGIAPCVLGSPCCLALTLLPCELGAARELPGARTGSDSIPRRPHASTGSPRDSKELGGQLPGYRRIRSASL